MNGEPIFFELGVDGRRARAHLLHRRVRLDDGARARRATASRSTPAASAAGCTAATPARRRTCSSRVDDIEAALARVRELGGTVEDTDVEGDAETTARFGRFKLCRDDQGSPFGLHQPPAGLSYGPSARRSQRGRSAIASR